MLENAGGGGGGLLVMPVVCYEIEGGELPSL